MAKSAPYECVEIDEAEKAERRELYTHPATVMVDVVRTKPFGCILGKKFATMADKIYNFEVRPDDVWMISYPKAGSTWTQEMVWQVVHGVDLEGGKENIFFRSPFFEMSVMVGELAAAVPSMESKDPKDKMARFNADSIEFVRTLTGPRVIKTHLPLSMLPPNLLDTCKVVFASRNPKDSCVSFFHHELMLPPHGLREDADFNKFAAMYRDGNCAYGDYFEHFKSNSEHIGHPNMLHFWFEDMKKDLSKVVKDLAAFLGKELSDDKVTTLVEHLQFDKMKNNDAVNHRPPKGSMPEEVRAKFNFIRKGQVGESKNFFTDEAADKEFDAWIEKGSQGVKGFRNDFL
jgi:hypothetical protein